MSGQQVKAIRGVRSAEERGLELYETEPEAVEALMAQWPEYFASRRRIFEPSCGPGAIVDVLEGRGHDVVAADIANYERRWKGLETTPRYWGMDFFDWGAGKPFTEVFLKSPDAIVMNPPYSRADEFVSHALTLAPRVFALLELSWLSGTIKNCPERARLIDGGHLIAFHPFRNRLKMHADNFEGKRNKTARQHCWFVFDREPTGAMAAVMRRVSVPRRGNQHG